MQSRHPSIIKVDVFCIVRDIRYQKVIQFIAEEYVSLKSTLGLRKTLCNQFRFISYHLNIFVSFSNGCFISYHLIIFVSFQNENSLEPNRKDSERCMHHINEHISFLKRVKLSFNCLFPFVTV
jgi:hypothetical protein